MNEYILKFGNVNSNGRSYNHNSGWNFRYILAEDDEDAKGILYHFYLYEWERLRLGIPKRAPVGGRRPTIPLAYPLEDVEGKNWWSRGGSNSRPSHCERDALPAELRPHVDQNRFGNLKRYGEFYLTISRTFHLLSNNTAPSKRQ